MAPVFAYLDPGAGSLMLQAMVAGAGGLFVALRCCWHSLSVFGRQREAAHIEEQHASGAVSQC